MSEKANNIKEVNWTLTLWLSLFLGFFGVDRFVMGKIGTGILKLITAGGMGVWYLIDLIMIMSSYKYEGVSWKFPKNKTTHIVIVIVLLVLLVIGNIAGSNSEVSTTTTTTTSESNEITISDDNFAQFNSNLWSKTDLQKKEFWKEHDGKTVKWTFHVGVVDTDMFGTYVVLGTVKKPDQYTFDYDLNVKFKDSEKDKLLKFNRGDLMTITGTLDDYSEIPELIMVKEATVSETEEMEYAVAGKDSSECVKVKEACDAGNMNACQAKVMFESQGVC